MDVTEAAKRAAPPAAYVPLPTTPAVEIDIALKQARADGKRLVPIEGSPPNLLVEPTFCPFAPRCRYAFDRCLSVPPPLVPVGDQHEAACFYDLTAGRPRQ